MEIKHIHRKAKNIWRKNWPDLKGLLLKCYPEFVTKNITRLDNEIPVFTFHNITQTEFESQLQFLKENGYQTINCDTLLQIVTGSSPLKPKTIMLTFDDGHKSLYSIAYPLLKKYNLTSVAFICPGLLSETGNNHDLISWEEAQEMQKDGIVDFQSHTMYHDMVFVKPTILEQIHSKSNLYFEKTPIPKYRYPLDHNKPLTHNHIGFPLFQSSMKMKGKRKILFTKDFMKNYQLSETCEHITFNLEENAKTETDIYDDLKQSRNIIEQKLGGKVYHLAYPLYEGSLTSVKQSKKAGYHSNFWGVLWGKRTNTQRSDPFFITRISDYYLYRLPGKGQKSLSGILKEHVKENIGSLWRKT